MARLATTFGAVGLVLMSCAPQIAVQAPSDGDLASEAVTRRGDTPPPAPDGVCWVTDQIPAMYETVTEQTLVAAEVRNAQGEIVSPATYKTVARLRQEQARRDLWIKSPCPESLTVDFVATLQRALKARGYYTEPLTGVMDPPTTESVRRYQAEHGLDSPVLTLAATRQLGIVTTALDQL